jgi:hypothetical protein
MFTVLCYIALQRQLANMAFNYIKALENKLVVAAIDFGTSYSGFAYSFKDVYKRNPLMMSARSGNLGSGKQKTPTTLLLSPTKEFVAFGFKAESMYARLADDDQDKDYYYFRRFKMCLHRNKVI